MGSNTGYVCSSAGSMCSTTGSMGSIMCSSAGATANLDHVIIMTNGCKEPQLGIGKVRGHWAGTRLLPPQTWTMLLSCQMGAAHAACVAAHGACTVAHAAAHDACKLKRYVVPPDLVMYSTVIDSLCKVGLVNEEHDLYLEMIAKGIPPNVVTISSLLYGFCIVDQLKEANRLLKEMVPKNVNPSIVTYNICDVQPNGINVKPIVQALLEDNENDKAEKLLRELIATGRVEWS
ncbi:hypothetical protein L6164_001088 [Bauhinia variegata]|uniref:Uncharacterized protein n=1 Tax=Bauhinia variegata TaxID=167791 RepID=A0ACB9Q8Z8_BAUVA|nr:hypothetical protein L6164_001088 [Bauhinia variegata]